MRIAAITQQFLNDNEIQDLINQYKFKEVYDIARKKGSSTITSDLSRLCLESNINPLNYMENVPTGFLNTMNVDSFDIPDHIKTIDGWAFDECTRLSNVKFPKNLSIIGPSAFYNTNLNEVDLLDTKLKTIYREAFASCNNLSKIYLPSTLKEIQNYVFEGDWEIDTINYNGTKQQWYQITKYPNWNEASTIKYIDCIDGEIDLKF